jgi:hypothetical protein
VAGTTEGATPDPQWAYTLAIRSALEQHGRFETELDERDAQAVVDLHWAARQAGRLLGVRVRVVVGGPVGRAEYIVTATVHAIDQDGRSRAQAELGLQRLLGSVRAVQGPARPVEVEVHRRGRSRRAQSC